MATYKKVLRTLEIHLLLDSEAISVADTVEDAKASMALSQFKQYSDMVWKEEGEVVTEDVVVPYHAVQYIKVTETPTDVEETEAYDCEKSCCK